MCGFVWFAPGVIGWRFVGLAVALFGLGVADALVDGFLVVQGDGCLALGEQAMG